MKDIVVYLSFEKNNAVAWKNVTVGSVAEVFCEDKSVENKVKAISIHKIGNVKKERYVVSVIEVLEKIHDVAPGVRVENLGETDFIIDYIDDTKSAFLRKAVKLVNVCAICLLIFFGGTFTIIAYYNDVDMNGIFDSYYSFLQGKDKGSRIMEAMFSLGVGLGVIVFFNHFGGKKITTDPTPIEVEMSAYEDEIDDAIIDGASKSKRGKKGND